MAEVGSAFVSIIPSMKGFGSSLDSQVGAEVDKSGKRAGGRFGNALQSGAKVVATAAGAVLGTALFKGFDRLNQIEQARAKLTGLGHTTKNVDTIMTSALNSVKGTAFGLGEAGTVAASAVAAGVKPGRELQKTLGLVADAATIGGTSLGEMGAIFNKVATSNKVQGEVINQLNDRGIPIIQLLGKSLGKTSEEVLEMSEAGTIGFAEFSRAMQSGLGGAALESGNTFTGAFKNVMASLGRIGANLLSGIFPHLAPGLKNITAAMAPLETGAKAVGDAIGKFLVPVVANIGPAIARFAASVKTMDFGNLANGSAGVGAGFRDIGASLKGIDLSELGQAFGQGAADTVSVFAVAIGFAADHIDTFAKILPGLIVAFAAYKTVQAAANVVGLAQIPIAAATVVANLALASANRQLAVQLAVTNGVEQAGMLTRIRATAATVATTVASRAAAVGSRIWAASQWLLNAALTANPIGIVVVAIAALVAGLIYAYRNSTTFRNIVNKAFAAVKNVVGSVISWFGKYVPKVFAVVVAVVKGYVNAYRAAITVAFNAARAVVTAVMRAISAAIRGGIAVFNAAVAGARRFNTGVVAAVRGALNVIREIPGKARAALGNLGGLLLNAGRELVQGLINGIGDRINAVRDKMRELASAVRGFFPGSPVKEGPLTSWNRGGAGKRLVGLLADGLGDTRQVDAAMARLSRRVQVAAPSIDGTITGRAGVGASAARGGAREYHIHESTSPMTTLRELARLESWEPA